MQVWENKNFDPASGSVDFEMNSEWSLGSNDSVKPVEIGIAEFLRVQVEPGQTGLRIVSIGKQSPLCRLLPLGRCGFMQGLVESGDRIVAIDGILARNVTDLARLVDNPRFCEITIFDHRTRLTVSWQFPVRTKLKIA